MTVITPCTHPDNLYLISLMIPSDVRWIVVFDSDVMPIKPPDNCEAYCHQKEGSVDGNAQRNYGLTLVESGYVYFMNDDTLPHPKMWRAVSGCEFDMVVFRKAKRNGMLWGNGYVVNARVAKQLRFKDDSNIAQEGYFHECYKLANTRYELNEVLALEGVIG